MIFNIIKSHSNTSGFVCFTKTLAVTMPGVITIWALNMEDWSPLVSTSVLTMIILFEFGRELRPLDESGLFIFLKYLFWRASFYLARFFSDYFEVDYKT